MPPGSSSRDSQAIEPMIGPHRLVQGAAAAGELGRIEHHAAEPFAGLHQRLQGLEPVAALETHIRQAVSLGVGPRQVNGLLAGIDAQHLAVPPRTEAAMLNPPL